MTMTRMTADQSHAIASEFRNLGFVADVRVRDGVDKLPDGKWGPSYEVFSITVSLCDMNTGVRVFATITEAHADVPAIASKLKNDLKSQNKRTKSAIRAELEMDRE